MWFQNRRAKERKKKESCVKLGGVDGDDFLAPRTSPLLSVLPPSLPPPMVITTHYKYIIKKKKRTTITRTDGLDQWPIQTPIGPKQLDVQNLTRPTLDLQVVATTRLNISDIVVSFSALKTNLNFFIFSFGFLKSTGFTVLTLLLVINEKIISHCFLH